MSDTPTFQPPETAWDAATILLDNSDASDVSRLEALSETVAIAESYVTFRSNETVERAWNNERRIRKLLERVPYAVLESAGQGDAGGYRDDPVSLWVDATTEGYGRNRPDASKGLYLEMKLDAPYRFRSEVETAFDEYGIDFDDLMKVANQLTDYMIESDALEWAIENDWGETFKHYGCTNLAEAYKQGRIKRSYKGVLLEKWITFGEALEAQWLIDTGLKDAFRDGMAKDWLLLAAKNAMRGVYELESYVDLIEESKGKWKMFFDSDEEEAKVREASKPLREGGRMRVVTSRGVSFD